jgi:ketosteroid isomerase-like protein
MRPLSFPVILVSLGAILAASISTQGADRNPVRAVLDDQVAAWNRGDIDGFMQAYARSPNTTFVSGDEVTRGWQTVRNRYAKKYDSREKMGTLTFSEVEITFPVDDVAVALGSWSLQRKNDRPHGKFTLLFRHFPQGWRIVLDHTS